MAITKYWMKFFPVKQFTQKLRMCKLIPVGNSKILLRDKYIFDNTLNSKYLIKTKELLLLYATYKTFKYSKIGSSFAEKRKYFKAHNNNFTKNC